MPYRKRDDTKLDNYRVEIKIQNNLLAQLNDAYRILAGKISMNNLRIELKKESIQFAMKSLTLLEIWRKQITEGIEKEEKRSAICFCLSVSENGLSLSMQYFETSK